MNDKSIIGGVVILLLAAGGILFVMGGSSSGVAKVKSPTSTEEVVPDNAPKGALELAQCLSAKGATFYGAFWCSHCRTQRALFGSAVTALPYVECSSADGNSQMQICKEKKIQGYPTWIFADGTMATGEQSFSVLAEKSGCPNTTLGDSEALPPPVSVVPVVSGSAVTGVPDTVVR